MISITPEKLLPCVIYLFLLLSKYKVLSVLISFCYRTPAKSKLLHREVVRLVTPGTLLEPLNSDANYLMSIAQGPDSSLGLAWLDLSTGEFYLGVSSIENLEEDLSRVSPAEVGGIILLTTVQKDS